MRWGALPVARKILSAIAAAPESLLSIASKVVAYAIVVGVRIILALRITLDS